MSAVDELLKISTDLEKFFDHFYKAKGNGLNEKVNSVRNCLSRECIQHVRYIARIRNIVCHDNPALAEQEIDKVRERANAVYRLCGHSEFNYASPYTLPPSNTPDRNETSLSDKIRKVLYEISDYAEKGCVCLLVVLFFLCLLLCLIFSA